MVDEADRETRFFGRRSSSSAVAERANDGRDSGSASIQKIN
jgi:hypothetical protein